LAGADKRKRCADCGCVLRANPRGAGKVHYGSIAACQRFAVLRDALREAEAGLVFALAGGCGCRGAFACAPHSALLIVRAAIASAVRQ
jgi:hypothetical protein